MSTRDREALGWIAFVLLVLTAPLELSTNRFLTQIPGWGGILLVGLCLGVLSVLFYNYPSWKAFGECMYVSLRSVLALFVVLGAASLIAMLVAPQLIGLLVLFVYYGGPVYVWLAMIALACATCAGGAFTFVVLQVSKLSSRQGRA
jgi:hypothetical protein